MAAQATVSLEKAKRAEPTSRSIREALGIAYFRIGRWEEAEAEFRALVELAPADDFAHYALGRALVNQGRRKEATPHIKLARSLRPRRPPATRSSSFVRAVVQRVRDASVRRRRLVAEIGPGLSSCSASRRTASEEAERLAGKVARLRIFENEDGRFDRSLLDVEGEALVVSQFTLIADTREGNWPSFTRGRGAGRAEPLYERFCDGARERGRARRSAVSSGRAWRSRSSTTGR